MSVDKSGKQSFKKLKLKPLSEQVIVITGASSGIGLATARMAAEKGAKVAAAARNLEALEQLVHELKEKGQEAVAVQADVGKEEDVRHIAEKAIQTFGGFDTWVNNAGVTIYGQFMEISIEDMKRMFDTDYWVWCTAPGRRLRTSNKKKQPVF